MVESVHVRQREAETIREMWDDLYPQSLIAVRLSRSEAWVCEAVSLLNLPPRSRGKLSAASKLRKVQSAAKVARNCLRCSKSFEAETKFLRLCGNCRHV